MPNQTIQVAYREAVQKYGRRSAVTAIDVGFKWSAGAPTTDLAIRIHMREKVAVTEVLERSRIPDSIGDASTDVIEAIYADSATRRAPSARLQRRETLVPGISVGARRGLGAGTLGMIAFDRASGSPGILSNWHVLAGPRAADAQRVVQPAPQDRGRQPRDVVGSLSRSLLNRNGDAAFALLGDARPFSRSALTSGVTVSGTREPVLGDELEKSGRSTQVTRARIDGIGRYYMRYAGRRIGIDGFRLVPLATGARGPGISGPGDSGSVWYDDQGRGVGLHFGGDSRRNVDFAVACSLERVLDRLSLTADPPPAP